MSDPTPTQPPASEFVALAPGDASEATTFQCPLCGGRFSHGTRVCGGCPLNAGCEIVACPSCGYGFPRTSRVVEGIRRLWRKAAGTG
jgi:hypothetical protein